MMTETYQQLLKCISESLFLNSVSVPINEPLIQEALNQAVVSLLPFNDDPRYYNVIANNTWNERDHYHLHELLTQNNIPYCILKGMASAEYYPESVQRTMGDVDFIVRREDVEKVGQILIADGFTAEKAESTYHIAYQKDGCEFELHWNVPGMPEGNDKLEELMSTVIDEARDVNGLMLPFPFHHGVILLLHTAEHMLNTGIGLRHLCDWAVFSASFSDDEFKNLFKSRLKSVGLWRFAQLLSLTSVRYLKAPYRSWMGEADDELLEGIIEDVFSGGNFGVKDSDRINQAKLLTNDKTRGTSGGTLHHMMQTITLKAELAWPVCQKVRILLPLGWIYVCSRHLIRIGNGKRPKIHLKSMVKGAKERKSIYDRFELFH